MYSSYTTHRLTVRQKIRQLNWGLIFVLTVTAAIGVAMLYSAGDGSWTPWAVRQALRYAVGICILLAIALIDIRFWWRNSYVIYGLLLCLLISVEIIGSISMGAQRWINLGLIRLQPSELMKVALIVALARYFHGVSIEDSGRLRFICMPLILIGAPAVFVLKQPDLGTAVFIILTGLAVLFVAGLRLWKFGLVLGIAAAAIPIVWGTLHRYQQKRILTFLDPESDPLGAGYHIMQSKIAFGSGGLTGKGFMLGSQSHLNFLPEKQTDFIFTMVAEEFGLLGGLILLGLYIVMMVYGVFISLNSRSHFGRLLAMGITSMLFLYVFINIAMVMGIVPVVGVPLPLISYGGNAMLSVLIGVGFLINVHIHRDIILSRSGNES